MGSARAIGELVLLRWWSGTILVIRDGCRADLHAQLQQLAMNVRRAPGWVVHHHLADEFTFLAG